MANDTLLITCPGEDGGLFMVNGESCVRLSGRASTGLFVEDDHLLLAYQEDDGKSVRLIRDGLAEDINIETDRLDLHDVLLIDGKTYVVATEINSVICLDEKFHRIASWGLPGENDSSHINSVVIYEGKLLASVFGRFTQHREYKIRTLGCGEVIDIKSGETFIGGLSQPHSLTVVDNLLYLCSSEEHEVRIYRHNQLIQIIKVSGYARGLAVTQKSIYVGISMSRNVEDNVGDATGATIVIINKKTMQVKGQVSLPCREIYDIRAVNNLTSLVPHLLNEQTIERAKYDERLAQYKHGYESYKLAYEELEKTQQSLMFRLMHSFRIKIDRIWKKN